MYGNREALIQSIKALMGEEGAKMANIEALSEDELEELLQDLRSGGVVSEDIEDVLTEDELAELYDDEEYDEPGTMSEEEWEALLKDIDNMPDDEEEEIIIDEKYPFDDEEEQ
jgi:DNA-directed RNA polymerase specialized sigma24 family protein